MAVDASFWGDFVQVAQSHIYEAADKQDGLADALLRALAYASSILRVSNLPVQPVIAAMDQEAQSQLAHVRYPELSTLLFKLGPAAARKCGKTLYRFGVQQ